MRGMGRRLQSLVASAVAAVCLWTAALLVLNRPPGASLLSMVVGAGLFVLLGLTTARVAVSLWNGPPNPPA
jgi:hypothetical protein